MTQLNASLCPSPVFQFIDKTGAPLSGGLVFTYLNNTNTPAATYVDAVSGTPNTNPIVLDSYGSAEIWLPPGQLFTFVISPSTDTNPPTNPIRTVNNILGSGTTFNFGIDTGVVNALTAAIPGLPTPFQGVAVTIDVAITNTGAATLNVNGFGAQPIVLQNGAALAGGELQAGGQYLLQFTGTSWQILGFSVTAPNAITAAEIAASVVPVNYQFPPGAIERYYSGTGDATIAIQNALNSNARVFSFYGWQTPFAVSNYLLVPAGVTFENAALTVTGSIPEYVAWNGDHQDQVVLLAGDHAKAQHLQINCGAFSATGVSSGFTAGGVALRNNKYNDVSDCEIFNGTQQGILILCSIYTNNTANGSLAFTCHRNRIYYMLEGIQVWGAQSGAVTGNSVRVISGGGIWSVDSIGLSVTGNDISDCGDVGLDLEGGQDIVYSGNTVRSCVNGEITWFHGGVSGMVPHNTRVANNTAHHTATYLVWNGTAEVSTACASGASLYLTSVLAGNAGQYGIVFANNLCTADVGTAFYVANLYGGTPPAYSGQITPFDCGFIVEGNEFIASNYQTYLHNVQRAWNIIVRKNTFKCLGTNPSSVTNEFRDCSGGVWDDNTYWYQTGLASGQYALYYYTDINPGATLMPVSPVICNNKFLNTGDLAFKHQPYLSGIGAILFGNQFTQVFTANAGCLSTTDGYPIFRGEQPLLYTWSGTTTAALNLTSIIAIGNSQTYCEGTLSCTAAGVVNANYSIAYASNGPTVVSRDSSGSGSGNPVSSTNYATFSGSTITVTGTGSVGGNLTLCPRTNQ